MKRNMKEENKKFLMEMIESDVFGVKQLAEIASACDRSIEQVKIIANPELNLEQMRQLRKAFENGASIKEVQQKVDEMKKENENGNVECD